MPRPPLPDLDYTAAVEAAAKVLREFPWDDYGLAQIIARKLEEAGFLVPEDFDTVEVRGARVPVETVEVYGLTITVDANGNAVSITSPYGFEISR